MNNIEELLENLGTELGLSDSQSIEVNAIIRKFTEQLEIQEGQHDGEMLQAALKPIRQERNQALKSLLNEEQFGNLREKVRAWRY